MRTRTEIELEKIYHADKAIPDGSEERQLLALILEVVLDMRDGSATPPPAVSAQSPQLGAEHWGK
jgi:hypothetical protein